MGYRTKYRIATAILAVSVVGALMGFSRVQGEALSGQVSPLSFVMLFGGAAVGISAELCRYFWRSRLGNIESQKIAMQTLGEVGRQQMLKKNKKKIN